MQLPSALGRVDRQAFGTRDGSQLCKTIQRSDIIKTDRRTVDREGPGGKGSLHRNESSRYIQALAESIGNGMRPIFGYAPCSVSGTSAEIYPSAGIAHEGDKSIEENIPRVPRQNNAVPRPDSLRDALRFEGPVQHTDGEISACSRERCLEGGRQFDLLSFHQCRDRGTGHLRYRYITGRQNIVFLPTEKSGEYSQGTAILHLEERFRRGSAAFRMFESVHNCLPRKVQEFLPILLPSGGSGRTFRYSRIYGGDAHTKSGDMYISTGNMRYACLDVELRRSNSTGSV